MKLKFKNLAFNNLKMSVNVKTLKARLANVTYFMGNTRNEGRLS